MPEEITIKDVAKLVGFSTGTVSRVLNGAPNVNPEINSRILRVLKESGYLAKERYRPGRRTRRCGSRICMLAPDMSANWLRPVALGNRGGLPQARLQPRHSVRPPGTLQPRAGPDVAPV